MSPERRAALLAVVLTLALAACVHSARISASASDQTVPDAFRCLVGALQNAGWDVPVSNIDTGFIRAYPAWEDYDQSDRLIDLTVYEDPDCDCISIRGSAYRKRGLRWTTPEEERERGPMFPVFEQVVRVCSVQPDPTGG